MTIINLKVLIYSSDIWILFLLIYWFWKLRRFRHYYSSWHF